MDGEPAARPAHTWPASCDADHGPHRQTGVPAARVPGDDEVDTVLKACRILVAITARWKAAVPEVVDPRQIGAFDRAAEGFEEPELWAMGWMA